MLKKLHAAPLTKNGKKITPIDCVNSKERKECPTINNAQFLGNGWDWIIELFYNRISITQGHYLKLKSGKYAQLNPSFSCDILQVKEKFGSLRIYFQIDKVELPSEFDQEWYDDQFCKFKSELSGYLDALESVSARTCEISGQRGSSRSINGWCRTLSDEEYAKITSK